MMQTPQINFQFETSQNFRHLSEHRQNNWDLCDWKFTTKNTVKKATPKKVEFRYVKPELNWMNSGW